MGNPKKETCTWLILVHASTRLGHEYTQRWVLWVLKWVLASASTCSEWVLVFVWVFTEYLYDVSCLHNQIKFTYAWSGVLQTALVSAFVVEWAKNGYIGLFYMLQSILKSSNKPYTCCWGSPPTWTESFCCVVAVGHRRHVPMVSCVCIIAVRRRCCRVPMVSCVAASQWSGVVVVACPRCHVLLRCSSWASLSLCTHGVSCCGVVAGGNVVSQAPAASSHCALDGKIWRSGGLC